MQEIHRVVNCVEHCFPFDMLRQIDKLMKRTQDRPLASGRIAPRNALVFAVALEVSAFAFLWQAVNPLSAALAVAACLFYVFVYTLWLKRTSKSNIVIGGAAGAVPVLIGWSAVTSSLDWAPVVLFLAYPVIAFFRGPVRRCRLRALGHCRRCGYNLTGLPEPRCPECGTAI